VTESLEHVLADERAAAVVLRDRGFGQQADMIEGVVDRVEAAASLFLTWLGESDAKLWTGWSDRTIRRRFRELYDSGNARVATNGAKQFRAASLPRRADVEGAREAGRRGIRRVA
jgi:hypothetical protein